MHSSRETKLLNTLSVVLVLAGGALRAVRDSISSVNTNTLIGVLLLVADFIWIGQVRRRLIRPLEQGYLTAAALLVASLTVLRTVKYVFLPADSAAARYTWYLYYVPQTFAILLLFFAVLHIGRPYGAPPDRRVRLLYIPAVLLCAGILTNDFHQLAFRFSGGVAAWEDGAPYTHGPLYTAALVWMVAFFIVMLTIALTRCAVSENRKNLWLPLLPLCFGCVYCALYLFAPGSPLIAVFKVPEVVCFVLPAFLEGLILAGLFPQNDNYHALWNASRLSGGIMDLRGEFCYSSEQCPRLTMAQVLTAAVRPIPLGGGGTLLRSRAVSGGYGYWLRDVREINRINEQLAGTGDVLAEENAILEAENSLREKRLSIEQQNALYDSIARDLAPQLERLHILLADPPADETEFERTMKLAAILNVYVKRRSNLLLLAHQGAEISATELRLAFAESLEYVSFAGIRAHGEYSAASSLNARTALLFYKIFEDALEAALPGTGDILVSLELAEDTLILRLEVSHPRSTLPPNTLSAELRTAGGTLTVEEDDRTEFITLTLPPEGHV